MCFICMHLTTFCTLSDFILPNCHYQLPIMQENVEDICSVIWKFLANSGVKEHKNLMSWEEQFLNTFATISNHRFYGINKTRLYHWVIYKINSEYGEFQLVKSQFSLLAVAVFKGICFLLKKKLVYI